MDARVNGVPADHVGGVPQPGHERIRPQFRWIRACGRGPPRAARWKL